MKFCWPISFIDFWIVFTITGWAQTHLCYFYHSQPTFYCFISDKVFRCSLPISYLHSIFVQFLQNDIGPNCKIILSQIAIRIQKCPLYTALSQRKLFLWSLYLTLSGCSWGASSLSLFLHLSIRVNLPVFPVACASAYTTSWNENSFSFHISWLVAFLCYFFNIISEGRPC